MDKKLSVLFIGESWFIELTERKGVDYFTMSRYEECSQWVGDALRGADMAFTHLPCHQIEHSFPATLEELMAYDVVMISDVGANTFLLPAITLYGGQRTPNKLEMLREFVASGKGLMMIGGYMTFAGIEGKARYHGTVIEEALPVTISGVDDRVEVPQGFTPEITDAAHPIFEGIESPIPHMLGYNRVTSKPGARVLMRRGDDPILSVWEFGEGRTMAYACDCSPHWASPELCQWTHYQRLWQNITRWLAKA